jgi:hypothetical protein
MEVKTPAAVAYAVAGVFSFIDLSMNNYPEQPVYKYKAGVRI